MLTVTWTSFSPFPWASRTVARDYAHALETLVVRMNAIIKSDGSLEGLLVERNDGKVVGCHLTDLRDLHECRYLLTSSA